MWNLTMLKQNLALIFILTSLSSYSTQTTYYVTPTPGTPCPGEPCHTLSELHLNDFSSNTTLVFLPGDHTLNHTIAVGTDNTWRTSTVILQSSHHPRPSLTLLGSPNSRPEVASRIVCTWPAGFVFSGITELHISALAFISCGHYDSAAISIRSLRNSSIVYCTFQNNVNRLRQNSAKGRGGVIHAYNSTLTLTGSTFQNNYDYRGGALFAVNSVLALTKNTFQNNTSRFGGTVHVSANSTLTLTENTFQNNTAQYGGAVVVRANNIVTLTENTFQNNTGRFGGAIFVHTNSTLTLTKNTFQNNNAENGGALLVYEYSILSLTENTFQYNSAVKGGGAITVSHNITLTVTRNILHNNIGGALYVHANSTLALTENTFQNNTAENGGAISVSNNSTLILTRNILRNNFVNGDGGALYVHKNNHITLVGNAYQNNSANSGGALWIDQDSTVILTENTFQNNLAKYVGGALCVHQGSTLILTENTFQNNSAEYGGALYIDQDNVLTVMKNTFQNTLADGGGALYIHHDNTLILTKTTFRNNVAVDGGALYIHRDNTLTLTKNTFQNNFAEYGGALYIYQNSTLTFTENLFDNNSANITGGTLCTINNNTLTLSGNIFRNNLAYIKGGVLYAYQSGTLSLTRNVFQNNSATDGGVLLIDRNNTLTLVENVFYDNIALNYAGVALSRANNTLTLTKNTFQSNLAPTGGALCSFQNSSLSLTKNIFRDNSASKSGGAIHTEEKNALYLAWNTFQNNLAPYNAGGALSAGINNTITLTENVFLNNSAFYGGAVSVYSNTILTLIENFFQNNSAINGGALYTYQSIINITNNTFAKNTARLMGGMIFCIANSNLSIHGEHRLWNNTAEYGGGVAALQCKLTLAGNISFESNTAAYGGGLYTDGLYVRISGCVNFINNSAIKDGGGAYASRSLFTTEHRVTFVGNSALNSGGGMMLTGDAKLYFKSNAHINFTNNLAIKKGGALMIEESTSLSSCAELSCNFLTGTDCFFQIQTQNEYAITTPISEITELDNIRIHFKNNTALEAGATLYGSSIDNCGLRFIQQYLQGNLNPYECSVSGKVFNHISSYESLSISSDPLYICACEVGKALCSSTPISITVYPGSTINVSVIAYGQRNGTTPAVIHNITPNDKITFSDLESTQNTTTTCTVLKYTIQTRAVETFQKMKLFAGGPCPPREKGIAFTALPTNVLTIDLKIPQCPPGFELSETQPACICEERLMRLTDECQINDKTIKRDSELWVGYVDDGNSRGLILHSHCPFDYCSSSTMYMAVDNSDKQCSNNRSGLLCGKCSQNFSLALGSSHCLQCSHHYLWLLVVFAVAGLALVFLVLGLNLTVAAGTINGLVFYANVLAVNSAIFFQPQTTNILTVFIAWLNLDLGIEVCFYDGMDTYAKQWLQFVFPLYVWALVIGIITVSHYSIRISTILSNSTVAVLATLILLSYAKLFRTVIAALSFTLLEYPNNQTVAVWLYDANIRYLSSKHIPLFIAALVCLIFLFIPYTLVLLFGQWIRKSRLKVFCIVNNYRVLFFQEAYHAPYTERHRYWTGLMLIVRCYLFLVFTFNVFGDPSINLLCIASATILLYILSTLLRIKVYKTFFLNVLELSFNSNLCIVTIATLYIRSAGGNQNAVTFTSISVAFVTFVGIVIYHLVQQLKEAPRWWRRMCPSQSNNSYYNPVPQRVADPEPQGPAVPSPVDPSNAQFAVTYININDIVRAQLDESAYRDTNL